MAFLELKNIGKIYVSEGNVSVGIRGVNAEFERGEFVAVTGASGSGKSTLLNVISGMDSYEEGELYIEGRPTSHYLQLDWEEYRKEYISFVFADYNILESFTVQQNVEMALMNIDDVKERKRRASELIERVGLTKWAKHKGSKLSGGQKQRTVIARALAKDSPIILADEPTGNLDSETSKEIIALLKEVSKDKLLIVVTHNFDQVEEVATRHIRIYDGAVEQDKMIHEPEKAEEAGDILPAENPVAVALDSPIKRKKTPEERKQAWVNAGQLGKALFFAKPKLSIFLSIVMLVACLGIFFDTASNGNLENMLKDNHMFTYMEGRVVIVPRNGVELNLQVLKKLAEETGAKSYMRFDSLLDRSDLDYEYVEDDGWSYVDIPLHARFGEKFGRPDYGRYPEADNEVLLYLPLFAKPHAGQNLIDSGYKVDNKYTVVGVKYFIDNRKDAILLFTEEGFRLASVDQTAEIGYIKAYDGSKELKNIICERILPAGTQVPNGKVYFLGWNRKILSGDIKEPRLKILFEYVKVDENYYYDPFGGYYGYENQTPVLTEYEFRKDQICTDDLDIDYYTVNGGNGTLQRSALALVSTDTYLDIRDIAMDNSYRQASLFYGSDSEAKAAFDKLHKAGFITALSSETYEKDPFELIGSILGFVFTLISFVLVVFVLAFLVNLVTKKSIGSLRGDVAIMRSMGIPVEVVRKGMYVRTLLSLIPGIIVMIVLSVCIFVVPKFNGMFVFLSFWKYLVIVLSLAGIIFLVTRKQIKDLFDESVRKTLRRRDN